MDQLGTTIVLAALIAAHIIERGDVLVLPDGISAYFDGESVRELPAWAQYRTLEAYYQRHPILVMPFGESTWTTASAS